MQQNNAPDSCSREMDNPHGKIQLAQSSKGVVLDQLSSVQSDKTSSRVVKKKKIVKRMVKKVLKPHSYKFSPLSANILVGTLMAGGVTCSRSTASASVKIKKASLEDKSTEDKRGTHSNSHECNTDKGSDIGIEKVANISKPSSCDNSKEDKKIDPRMPDTGKVAKSLNDITSEVNHTNVDKKNSCQTEGSLSPGKDSNVGCPQSSGDNLINTHLLNALDSISSEDVLKSSLTFENLIGISNDGRSQVEVNDGTISCSSEKRIVYVKSKPNQLIATSNLCGLSVSMDDKTQTACSGSYYKNGNNQLLRTSFVSHTSPKVIMSDVNVNSGRLGACKAICSTRFNKRRSQKVAGSLCKPFKTSLVWTLSGKSSPKNDVDSRNCQKFLSQLFPWKRSIFRRRYIQNPASSSDCSSLSAIRSTHGFSLRKSNVLGVHGSNLKWSKSIYRRSTKVLEEATLPVAAVEREKREKNDVACNSSQAKNNEPLPSASIQLGLAAEGYIPSGRRYVRIGNGNQLIIRDPKKRTQMLANEKVRWSLHTARQGPAQKQKYCQFFTRFGKCNKCDGKCPYIHDPSKVAVCTKFLNGLCSNTNCKLTHKVIPERMPDCSYFLQGLCTNRNCPYRHVKVNPKASICGEFLKGYCGDGNECRKKHSYVCPTFEETGR